MIRKKLYPKTPRISDKDQRVVITEKMDGANLSFFKVYGSLSIAQRNIVYTLSSIDNEEVRDIMPRGLYGWLKEYGEQIEAELQDKACVIGEFMGPGKLKYPEVKSIRFLQFAKANVDPETLEMHNIYYDHDLFKWSYIKKDQPEYIKSVPVVDILYHIPTIRELNGMYADRLRHMGRDVEGFVVVSNNAVSKYVRMKDGTLRDHSS